MGASLLALAKSIYYVYIFQSFMYQKKIFKPSCLNAKYQKLEKQDTKYPYCGAEMPPDTRIPKTPGRACKMVSFACLAMDFSGWYI